MSTLGSRTLRAAACLVGTLALTGVPATYIAFAPAPLAAQQTTGRISGTVTNETGQPLPDVQVAIPATRNGAVTGPTGLYTISGVAPGTYQVRAQRIGFAPSTQTVTVAEAQTVTADFQLRVTATTLSDVVVVGYTTQQRRDVSDAVASVTGDQLQDQKVATVEEALRGKVPGVQIASSGEPGRPAQIIIRGQTGFGNPSPLYVIDGMYVGENPNLNPDDIESIDVLKDASAAAQYGAQASNGVIVIRTRHGQGGRTDVRVSTYYGFQSVPKRIDMMNAQQWAALTQQAYQNAGLPVPQGALNPGTISTDWQNAVFQRGAIQNYNLQVSGGTPTANYLVSGGFLDQTGTIITTNFRRYSVRVNSQAQVSRFTLGENIALSQGNQQGLNGYPLIDVVRMLPTIPVYDPNNAGGYGYGNPANPTYGTNPVGNLQANSNKFRSNQVLGTAYAELGIFHNLRYRFNVGLAYNDSSITNWQSSDQLRYLSPIPFASLSQASANGTSLLWENLLTFDDAFAGGKHRVNAVAGATSQRIDYNRLFAYRQGYPYENLQQIDAGQSAGASNSGFSIPFRTNSVLARLSYSLLDRYLLTGSARRDCSSRFSPTNRCGDFGAISAGWVVSQESFFQSIPALGRASFFKLRGSTGVLGDQNIGDFSYVAPIIGNTNYIFNGTVVPGAIQQALANPNLRWQGNRQSNAGFDLGLLNDALTLTADYYVATSNGLLVPAPIPNSLGSSANPVVNAGSVRNSGVELGLTHHLTSGRFQLNTNFNVFTTSNRVLSLGNGGQPIFAGTYGVARTAVGFPIGEFYVKHVLGIFQSQQEIDNYTAVVNGRTVKIQPNAQPGDIKYADLNGDGVINDQDRYNAGNGIPKVQGGLFFDGRYGAWDAGLNFRGSFGYKVYNVVKYWTNRLDDLNNSRADLTPWTPQNHSTTTPRAVYGAAGAANADPVSDRWLENGDFLRIQNLILGYTLPASFARRFNAPGLQPRIYLNIQNLYTFTKYSNWDPEILGFGDPLARGIDDGFIYPNPRTVTIGLDLRM